MRTRERRPPPPHSGELFLLEDQGKREEQEEQEEDGVEERRRLEREAGLFMRSFSRNFFLRREKDKPLAVFALDDQSVEVCCLRRSGKLCFSFLNTQ